MTTASHNALVKCLPPPPAVAKPPRADHALRVAVLVYRNTADGLAHLPKPGSPLTTCERIALARLRPCTLRPLERCCAECEARARSAVPVKSRGAATAEGRWRRRRRPPVVFRVVAKG